MVLFILIESAVMLLQITVGSSQLLTSKTTSNFIPFRVPVALYFSILNALKPTAFISIE